VISLFNVVPFLRSVSRLAALAAVAFSCALFSLNGCGSGAVSDTQASLTAAPATFSPALNATSVFIGASIIQNWPLPTFNRGIAGQTTSQVLARFQSDVVGHGYTRVIILCGTNDVVQNPPNLVQEATENLKMMTQIASDAGIQVVLSELPPVVSKGTDLNQTVQALNASIAQLAADHSYLVVDYFTPMVGHPEYFTDGVHPNSTGYAVMEKALAAVVRR
jgi:hypothetical protein